MGLTACHKAAAAAACIAATATAVLLWGVGAEAVFFRDYLQGGFLLADALIVTLLETLTVWQYLEWRRTRYQFQATPPPLCRPSPRLLHAVDTFRRAAVYALLSVPCFARVRRIWLPLVPGGMLLLSAALYTLKYCCALRKQRTMVKVPTFVRFKDESASAEVPPQAQPEPKLSHQSSFASSHSACSVQMGGSEDSGIDASQRDVAAAAAATSAASGVAREPRKPRGLLRACSSSPDRCCLISEDSLSLRD